jgi:hypothetical protein
VKVPVNRMRSKQTVAAAVLVFFSRRKPWFGGVLPKIFFILDECNLMASRRWK